MAFSPYTLFAAGHVANTSSSGTGTTSPVPACFPNARFFWRIESYAGTASPNVGRLDIQIQDPATGEFRSVGQTAWANNTGSFVLASPVFVGGMLRIFIEAADGITSITSSLGVIFSE